MPRASYDARKKWGGRTYTGMKVGRTHTWTYRGEWKERKIGPDLWDVSFRATKTRKGKAPAGSGAPVGTEYHWFFAPTSQTTRKLDANRYQTHLAGLKWKVGFRPATSGTWDYEWQRTGTSARRRMIKILEQTLTDLKAEERMGADPERAPDMIGERKVPRKKKRASTAPLRASRRAKAKA